jgi:UDP-N-acetylmuramyl pentapeptide synthase
MPKQCMKLFCLGILSKYAAKSFGQHGYHFNCHDELSRELCQQAGPNCCILVKGSRAMHMEDVVNDLVNAETVH